MIITLKGCTATAFIGGLNFFKVSKGTVSGADVTISTSTINKDAATSTSAREIATVALKSNYENLVVTVTMGGTTVNNWYKNGKVTIPANTTVTGNIKISASATAVSGGEETITTTYYGETVTVKDSISEMSFVSGYNAGTPNAGFTLNKGRASHVGEVLSVSGGETLTLSQPINGVTLTYSIKEFTTTPITSSVLTSGGESAGSWLSSGVTLQSSTRYIAISFKRGDGSSEFSNDELALLKQAISIS